MGTGNSSLGDPNMMALLGALAGTSQFAGASRLPQTFGQALGGAGAGLMAGIQKGQEYQQGQQNLTRTALENWAAQNAVGQQTGAMGYPAPSREDLLSGKGQIPWLDLFKQQLSGGSAAPQVPGSTLQSQIPGTGAGAAQPTAGYTPPAPGVGGGSYRALAAQKAQLANIDPDFFTAQIGAESNFNPLAIGPKTTGSGAPQQQPKGIAQIKDDTAKQWNVDPWNVDQALGGASNFIANHLQNGGTYVSAAQKYGTIPSDLSKMDANQQRVYDAAVAADQRVKLAQNTTGGTATDATGGVPRPAQAVPQAPGGGSAMMDMNQLRNVMLQRIQRGVAGIALTPVEQQTLAAQLYPAGSQMNSRLNYEAMKNAGLTPSGDLRPGGGVYDRDPVTGQPKISLQLPRAVEGGYLKETPGGGFQELPIPGSAEVSRTMHGAQAGGAAAGAQPYVQGNESFKGQTEAALRSNLPIDIHPGETVSVNPNRVPFPTPMGGAAPPPLAVPLPQGMSAGGAMPGVTGAVPGTTGAPPGAAVPSPTGGMTLQGMTPGQEETQKIQAKHEQDQRQTNINMASGAQTQNALIERMKLDVGNFPQGPLGAQTTRFQSYLRELGVGPDVADKVATAEEFNKNAGFILRGAVKETSSRAAVQEYKLISDTLPSQGTSPLGTIRVLNEFQGLNDYLIAKNQAQAAWENRTGSVHGFETDWQNKVTPNAFMMFRATPQDQQAVIQKLQSSPEGRAQLKTLATQMQYLKDTGLEHTIQ